MPSTETNHHTKDAILDGVIEPMALKRSVAALPRAKFRRPAAISRKAGSSIVAPEVPR